MKAQVTEAHRSLVRSFLHPDHWNTALEDCAIRLIADSEARAMEYAMDRMEEEELNPCRATCDQLRAKLHALKLVCGTDDANKFETWCDKANARADSAEAELARERERLDWLLRKDGETSDGERYEIEVSVTYNGNSGAAPRIPATREAIDAAMKESK